MSSNLIFNPHDASFSWDHALLLAEIAKHSYSGVEDLQKYLLSEFGVEIAQEIGSDPAEIVPEDIYCREFRGMQYDGEGYLIKLKGSFIICFRGTEKEPKDFMADAKVRMKPFPYGERGKVHRGFLQQYEEINEELIDTLHELYTGSEPIWITGHSLGAALATLAASELTCSDDLLGPNVKGLYTIGQPRTGDGEFTFEYAKRMRGKSFRFVNGNDIVTRVPLYIPVKFPYEHINQRLKFNEETGELEVGDQFIGYVYNELKKVFEEVKESWQEMWQRVSDRLGFEDHGSANYVAWIKKHREKNTPIEAED